MTKLEQFEEIVGQALIDFMGLSSQNKEDKEVIDLSNDCLSLLRDGYCLVQWPDSQEYMEYEWFNEEAVLDVEGKFGSSAYFIPIKRILN